MWLGLVTLCSKNKLMRLTNVARKITGVKQAQLQQIYAKRVRAKAKLNLESATHLMHYGMIYFFH